MSTHALIVAAGSGTRLGRNRPKQYLPIHGRPMLHHAIEAFLRHPLVEQVWVVIQPEHQSDYAFATQGLDLPPPIMGGNSRQASVRLGLEAMAEEAPEFVLIHDAARPFVSQSLISRVLDATQTHGAAIPALPVKDTIKRIENNIVQNTPDRTKLVAVQTPQGFRRKDIMDAHQQFISAQNITDDASLIEAIGGQVHIVEGEVKNMKITTKEDLPTETRTGFGYDVHAFDEQPTDHIMLGGVAIPHSRALKGHSDADVLLHALTDAILGTIAAGDIGMHFPPSDPKWKGAASEQFVSHAMELLREKGGQLIHADMTLIAEKPKLTPHRDAICANIARITGLDVSRISVKATTTEKLGFTGREEGIAAEVVATCTLGRSY